MHASERKIVLFVDDEPNVTQGLKRLLRPMRKEWDMRFVLSGPEALKEFEVTHIDVVVTDMRMPGMDGSQLLAILRDRYPETIRIVLSGQSSKEAVLRAVGMAHQYLSKPCDADTLRQTVTKAFKLRDILAGERLKSIVSRMETLPTLPETYSELIEEMQEDEPSLPYITRLIKQDVAMTAKVLQVVNSAYFGIRRKISSCEEAVRYLGLENISALVLAANIFGQMNSTIRVPGFSMTSLWSHSGEVARFCQLILKSEDASKSDIDDVFTAGLLHDCGRLIYSANMYKEYSEIIQTSDSTNRPLCDVEKEHFGANHAEVGAYLLGIWGLPDSIVEAVAFHHTPEEFPENACGSLTAVHVADAYSYDRAGASVNVDYLADIGLASRLPIWIELLNKSVGNR